MPGHCNGQHGHRHSVEKISSLTGDLYQVFRNQRSSGWRRQHRHRPRRGTDETLAEHDDVDAIWCFTDETSAAGREALSVGNLKQVFTNEAAPSIGST